MRTKKTKPTNYLSRKSFAPLILTLSQSQVNAKSLQSSLKNVIASPE
ncbi:hypothetical protein M1D52_07370 [Olivibacter sp. SA151]